MSLNPIKTAILTGLFTATATAAMAADLPRAFYPSSPIMKGSRDTSENWYLRGDIGYVHHKRPEADFINGPDSGNFIRESLGNTAVAGVGLGYRFGPNFRMDVTADHRFDARFKGIAPTPALATTSMADRGQFQSSTFMANGYVDFGTAGGFTPYVGAGIGVAHNVMSQYVRTTFDAETGVETLQRLPGGDDYSFAWALMAGVGYRVAPNFTLDLGYRYVSLGDVKTRTYVSGVGADVESLGAHEVRLGVRYSLK
jgi:opacity protein-like surface antigen